MVESMSDEYQIKPQGFPQVPENLSSIVKPEELVDIVEMSPLTLQDRRMYNLLIGNAWNDIFKQTNHSISRKKLTEYSNSNNNDIEASLRRLMASIVQIKIRSNRDGESSVRQIALLGSNEIGKRSNITYSFPPELVHIIKQTQIFARLHTKVMFQLSSKYALVLYEFLQRRRNLNFINSETLTVEEVRGRLGVPNGKLKTFGHLNASAIQPAVEEVSFLTEYKISVEQIRTGRKITHLKFSWQRKTDIGQQIQAVEELGRSSVGRKARMKGQVDLLEALPESDLSQKTDSWQQFPSQKTDSSAYRISSNGIERAKSLVLQAETGWDIYALEDEFLKFAESKKDKEPLHDVDKAFLGFVKKKVKQPPR